MRLNVKDRSFTIYQTLGSYDDVYVYLAREAGSYEDRYLINEVRCPQMIREHLGELLSLQEEANFSELVDIFTFNSRLYLVFKYAKPSPLMGYLHKYQLPFMEKLTLVDNYLFQLSAYTRLSPVMVNALTDPDNINVSGDGSVYFNFSLKPASFAASKDRASLFKGIASLLKIIFEGDLTGRKKQQLGVIMEKCERALYKSIPEVKKDMLKIDTSSTMDKVKAYLHARRHVLHTIKNLGISALVVVFFVLVYTQFIAPGPDQSPDTPVPVTQIGNITVVEEDPEENGDDD